MKTIATLCLTLTLFAAGFASAAAKTDRSSGRSSASGAGCAFGSYVLDSLSAMPPFDIPDALSGDSLAIVLPIADDSTEFLNVGAAVQIGHTFVGDLIVRLQYFANCSDLTPAAEVQLICRPPGNNVQPAPCGPGDLFSEFGAGSNVGTSDQNAMNEPDWYLFDDGAGIPMADGDEPLLVPPTCYRPSAGSFAGFSGLRTGGCFKLLAADYADEDTGRIDGLRVYSTRSANVPTRQVSWGSVKSIYR